MAFNAVLDFRTFHDRMGWLVWLRQGRGAILRPRFGQISTAILAIQSMRTASLPTLRCHLPAVAGAADALRLTRLRAAAVHRPQ